MHIIPTIDDLKTLPLFDAIPHDALMVIARGSHFKHLKKKEMLYFQGDIAEKCYVVLQGVIKVYLETSHSNESVICIASNKEILGDISIHEGARFLTSAQVVEDAELLTIPAPLLRQYIQTECHLASNLLKSVSCSMHKLVRQIEHQTVMTAPQRLGCLLLKLSRYTEMASNGGWKLPYEKRMVAAQLQMTPETFSRALDTLKQYGVHVDHATFTLDNPAMLSEFACKHCSRIPIPGEAFSCCDYLTLPCGIGQRKDT